MTSKEDRKQYGSAFAVISIVALCGIGFALFNPQLALSEDAAAEQFSKTSCDTVKRDHPKKHSSNGELADTKTKAHLAK